MPLALPLAQCGIRPATLVGGKARTLGRLIAAGLPVPSGICLTTDLLRRLHEETTLGDVLRKESPQASRHPCFSARALVRVRDAVRGLPLPMWAAEAIAAAAGPLLETGTVVVRSSAYDEDESSGSRAGLYASVIDVGSLESVVLGVRECWASLYNSPAALLPRESGYGGMAVILQPYIRPDSSGVMFTADPRGGESAALVEFDIGANQGVTGGWGARGRVRLRRDGSAPRGLSKAMAGALSKAAEQLEHLLGGSLDIEWAWARGSLVLFQARPIAAPATAWQDRATWAWQEDVGVVSRMDLGKCKDHFLRQLEKHIPVRRFCAESGIDTFGILYLEYDNKLLNIFRNDLDQLIRMPYVRIDWGGSSVYTPRGDMIAALARGRDRNRVGRDRTCARVGEVIPAEVEGFSTCLAGEGFLIEAFPAKLRGIKDGRLTPTTYVLDARGDVVQRKVNQFDRRGSFVLNSGGWEVVKVAPYELELEPAILERIAEITRTLDCRFGEARVEWYIYGLNVYFKDISIESNPIRLALDGESVLSAGGALGEVVVVRDIQSLETRADRERIGVVNTDFPGSGNWADDPAGEVLQRVVRGRKVILVAEYPSVGLIPLIRHVAGIVFSRGNLLCHTAIVLRERGIPGVIVPDALARLGDGDLVSISPSGVSVLISGSRGGR